MKTYEYFATFLSGLLGTDTAVRLTVNGYMPLSVEDIGQSAEGNRLISLSHYGEQNGDLMRDPEMVFELFTHGERSAAEPLSFQNDYLGVLQEVYRYDEAGKKTHVNTRLKAELKSFARLWFRNLRDQGSGLAGSQGTARLSHSFLSLPCTWRFRSGQEMPFNGAHKKVGAGTCSTSGVWPRSSVRKGRPLTRPRSVSPHRCSTHRSIYSGHTISMWNGCAKP